MKIKKIFALTIGLFSLAMLLQCASVPETHYYFLEFEKNDTQPANNAKYAVTLRVADFIAKSFYQDNSIVYREEMLEGKRYHYHRWAASPAEMFADQLIAQLRQSGLFTSVVDRQIFSKTDYLLTGELQAIEEIDRGEKWFGRVKVQVTLFDMRNNNPLWQKVIEKQTPVNRKEPIEVVRSINLSAQACVDEIIRQLDQYFSEK